MKIIVRPAINRDGFSFWLYQDDGHKLHVAKATELVFEEKDRHGAWELPEPTGFIRRGDFDELKASLLEELARAGLIDPNAAETAREMKATKYHLEDMRKLVFEPRYVWPKPEMP